MEKIKQLFFQDTLKRWHFEAIVKETSMSRERVNHYLKSLQKDRFIVRMKLKNKMPFYLANRGSLRFRLEKQFYGLQWLQQSGLFDDIKTEKGITSAMLFGSFARGDWGNSSDIDLFIYGKMPEFDKALYEKRLKREIQLLLYHDTKTMKKELDPKLIPNIAKGFNIKGNTEPFMVKIHA
jgi:predicted nucleotidyltransferase